MEKKESMSAPTPMAGENQPVDWMFAFKFNAGTFPGCDDDGKVPVIGTQGIFGGTVDAYKSGHSQQYIYATSDRPTLVKGDECLGGTLKDPLGATFGQVYLNPGYYYVLWNDQFYNNPIETKGGPFGHSKGMLAWNDDGEGLALQVSTPSWPASGSKDHPRQNDGNTLGCINDDDIEVSQHFFSIKINKADLIILLKAINNASVVTSTSHLEIVNNGGPQDVQDLVNELGKESKSTETTVNTLSSGIRVISKPSLQACPPWQLVSSHLNSAPLRVASWWARPYIYSTDADSDIQCWAEGLAKPGPVEIATTGQWNGTEIGLEGGEGTNFNHAKIGITNNNSQTLCIFGDMNQQGGLAPDYAYKGQKCSSSQNGRGGLFYVLDNATLHADLKSLIGGKTAPTSGPNGL
jgi:hypothetical protein